ncbi:MAG: hypothetical protein QW199_00670 [Candidatus Pacearchaeota archaeon]
MAKAKEERKKEGEDKKREKTREKPKKRLTKRLIVRVIIFVVIAILIVSVLFFALRPKPKVKIIENFSYAGLEWLVEDFGEMLNGNRLLIYHSEIFLPKYNITYRLFLRNDPRENYNRKDKTAIELDVDEIKALTYIAIDKAFDDKNCSELLLASYKLGEFLAAIQVKGEVAVWYENYTEPTYKSFIVINDYGWAKTNNATVILLKYGGTNQSRIYNNGHTIIIESAGCEILKSTERFMLFVVDSLLKFKEAVAIRQENFSNNFSRK